MDGIPLLLPSLGYRSYSICAFHVSRHGPYGTYESFPINFFSSSSSDTICVPYTFSILSQEKNHDPVY